MPASYHIAFCLTSLKLDKGHMKFIYYKSLKLFGLGWLTIWLTANSPGNRTIRYIKKKVRVCSVNKSAVYTYPS
jgi:hypothetical protein